MPASKFDDVLPILEGPAKLRLGACAMGDVADGDKLLTMQIWVWQKDGDKFAASAGKGGEHPGAHKLAKNEKLPFKIKTGWMVQTQLEKGSAQFSEGKPALAMAMALVRLEDGSEEVLQWNQAVMVNGRRNHEYQEADGGGYG